MDHHIAASPLRQPCFGIAPGGDIASQRRGSLTQLVAASFTGGYEPGGGQARQRYPGIVLGNPEQPAGGNNLPAGASFSRYSITSLRL